MRLLDRHLQQMRVVPCRPAEGATGGLFLVERPEQGYLMRAALRPDRKSERRVQGTLQPRERRLIITCGLQPIRQGDHVYFEADARCWHVMQRRDYPAHLEIEVEVAG